MKRRTEIQKENLELEKAVARLKEWNANREQRAKMKKEIERGLQRQRELIRQVAELKAIYVDGD